MWQLHGRVKIEEEIFMTAFLLSELGSSASSPWQASVCPW